MQLMSRFQGFPPRSNNYTDWLAASTKFPQTENGQYYMTVVGRAECPCRIFCLPVSLSKFGHANIEISMSALGVDAWQSWYSVTLLFV